MTTSQAGRFLCTVVPLAICVGCGSNRGKAADTLPPGHVRLAIRTPEGDRSCVVHAPAAGDRGGPLPLVIMLHGMGGTALDAVRETGWSARADERTFVIAYPEATRPDATKPPSLGRNPQAWNDGSGRFHAAERNVDDVAFLDRVIDTIAVDHSIDARRIFVAGFSNGASMAFRAAVELRHPLAAIAAHSGACWIELPRAARATSVWYLTGTADPLNRLEGGVPRLAFGGRDRGAPAKPPARKFIDDWRLSLGCPEAPRLDTSAGGVRTLIYGPGAGETEVAFITVEGLGHQWAGGTSRAPAFLVGPSTDKLVATDVIWDFFTSHPGADSDAGPGDARVTKQEASTP